MFTLQSRQGTARRGRLETVHGRVETPAFMNVATAAAIKGAVSADDLTHIGCQVALCNTYHLHLRPGEQVVEAMGGLRTFMGWPGPTLTDSGGFQVFSLAKLRRIEEQGVTFASHIDGRRIFMGPEQSMQIQAALGSTIAMAFDECVENPSPRDYVLASCARTTRWAERSRAELDRQNAQRGAGQLLFGINQGGTYADIRVDHMRRLAELPFDGYAIGGLAVGEPAEVMYEIIEAVEPHMPQALPRYLMGVGTPDNLLEAVRRGVDLFDCVMPSRNARHGHLHTRAGVINLNNEKYATDRDPIEPTCACPTCRRYSRGYLRHLFKAGELLAMRLSVLHNLWFYNQLMAEIRQAIEQGDFEDYYRRHVQVLSRRI
ncbi:MAG: tRNA guanosine(34) transglycosylase Tgt [Clostridiales bacterium]|nr:tRNA guanosine(34) transglycosylase Tgt [Clostridiales bacterium]